MSVELNEQCIVSRQWCDPLEDLEGLNNLVEKEGSISGSLIQGELSFGIYCWLNDLYSCPGDGELLGIYQGIRWKANLKILHEVNVTLELGSTEKKPDIIENSVPWKKAGKQNPSSRKCFREELYEKGWPLAATHTDDSIKNPKGLVTGNEQIKFSWSGRASEVVAPAPLNAVPTKVLSLLESSFRVTELPSDRKRRAPVSSSGSSSSQRFCRNCSLILSQHMPSNQNDLGDDNSQDGEDPDVPQQPLPKRQKAKSNEIRCPFSSMTGCTWETDEVSRVKRHFFQHLGPYQCLRCGIRRGSRTELDNYHSRLERVCEMHGTIHEISPYLSQIRDTFPEKATYQTYERYVTEISSQETSWRESGYASIVKCSRCPENPEITESYQQSPTFIPDGVSVVPSVAAPSGVEHPTMALSASAPPSFFPQFLDLMASSPMFTEFWNELSNIPQVHELWERLQQNNRVRPGQVEDNSELRRPSESTGTSVFRPGTLQEQLPVSETPSSPETIEDSSPVESTPSWNPSHTGAILPPPSLDQSVSSFRDPDDHGFTEHGDSRQSFCRWNRIDDVLPLNKSIIQEEDPSMVFLDFDDFGAEPG